MDEESPAPSGNPDFYTDFESIQPRAVPGTEAWIPTLIGYAMWITIPIAILAAIAGAVLVMVGSYGRGMTSADGMRRLGWVALGVFLATSAISLVLGLYRM